MPNQLLRRRFPFFLIISVFAAVSLTAADVVWQAGEDEDPFSSGYLPQDEFSDSDYSNTLPPGNVTRVPEDPLYNAASTPIPDDVGRGGRLLPSMSADLYFAELLRWFGVSSGNMDYVLPNIANFWDPASPTAPVGFVLP